MDENRRQAYLQLIDALLNCPSGEEMQILNANQDLIDAGLVETMKQVAEILTARRYENAAEYLQDVATQLATMIGDATAATPQEYLDFLIEVLHATSDSRGNPQVMYPLLTANQDKLDENFNQILREWATGKLPDMELEQRQRIAAVIGNFSNLMIKKFSLDRRAINLEIAITGYEMALTVYSREEFPQHWAGTQNNLANAYRNRMEGSKAENIEMAIACYKAALQILTREAFPEEWAETQNNLGVAYTYRIQGSKAENIEMAIACYEAALEVRTREAFPYEWAMSQYNLANAYSNRIQRSKAENIERAIAYYQAALLEVYTREAFPEDWAMTQNNLANAYSNRIQGSKAENIEMAIACYKAALEVHTREAFPQEWALTQNNLAAAYTDRIRGSKAKNIEMAIAYYQEALKVYTRKAFPQDWAGIQNNLGEAYRNRRRGEKAENIEMAIACYKAALEGYTREAFPYEWARSQNNLGIAYKDRIQGLQTENIEMAIAYYQAALQVATRKAFPYEWAQTQNNLANAYTDRRIQGSKAENIERAIACYQDALEICTPTSFPIECLRTGRNLGDTAFAAEQWTVAMQGYEQAIEAVEQSREWATTEDARRKIQENAIDVYTQMVQACINAGNLAKAIETVERSKARILVELIATRDLYPKGDIPLEILNQLDQLRRSIPAIQRELGMGVAPGRLENPNQELEESRANREQQLRQELQELQGKLDGVLGEINKVDPSFSLTQRVEVIPFSQIQSLLGDNTAILEWYITEDKFFTFIITPHTLTPNSSPIDAQGRTEGLVFWESSAEDLTNLENWRKEYLQAYRARRQAETKAEPEELQKQWQTGMASRLEQLAQILHIDDILSRLPETCNQLILVPHLYLHLLPLHALQVRRPVGAAGFPPPSEVRSQYCLLDLFPEGVRYAPSCQLLQLVQKYRRRKFQRLVGIQNPTKDLDFADLEVKTIGKYFCESQILVRDGAKKSALLIAGENPREIKLWEELLLAHCVHFSCHGTFNFDSPLDSRLKLADVSLTLADIFDHFNLSQCSLVTLSACETGMVDFGTSDECIGLSSGFILAGSPSVVATRWSVNQFSTALLIIKFYENLAEEPGKIAVALNAAQLWLRDTSVLGFLDWVNQS